MNIRYVGEEMKLLRISWVVGLVLFAVLVFKIGPETIWQNIIRLSLRDFIILMGLRFIYWGLRTLNWKIVLDRLNGKVGLGRIFSARLAGHAISYLTPSAHIGGEPIRALMLGNNDRRVNFASVVVDKTIEIMSMIFLMCFGVLLGLGRISLPGKTWIVIVAVVLSIGGLTVFIYYKQRTGMFSWIRNIMVKMRINPPFLARNAERIKETDRHISHFYRKHRGAFFVLLFLYLGLGLVWTMEIYITLQVLGVSEAGFFDSFLIVSLGNLAFLLPVIPAAIGTYEATYVGLFLLLGLGSGAAIALTLIRRILSLIWAGIGLIAMSLGGNALRWKGLFFRKPEEIIDHVDIDNNSKCQEDPEPDI